MAKLLPGLWITAPQRINFDNHGLINYSTSEIKIGQPPDFGDLAIESYYHTLIHELSHAIDSQGLDLKTLLKLKPYIPLQNILGYLKSYPEAVYNVLDAWGNMDLNSALEIKEKAPLLSLWGLPGTENWWRQASLSLVGLMGLNGGWLRDRINDYNKVSSRGIPEDDPTYLFNIAAHEYIKRLFSSSKNNPELYRELISYKYASIRFAIVSEVAHYMTGPAYEGGKLIVDKESQFNVLALESAKLESARLALLTSDGKIPAVDKIRKTFYPELEIYGKVEVSQGAEVYPWAEVKALLEAGTKYEGRLIVEDIDPNDEGLVREIRFYTLPSSPFIPETRLMLLLAKDYHKDSDPFAQKPLSWGTQLLYKPEDKREPGLLDQRDYLIILRDDLHFVIRVPEFGQKLKLSGVEYYYGGEKISSEEFPGIAFGGKECFLSEPKKLYEVESEVTGKNAEVKLSSFPSIIYRHFSQGVGVVPIPEGLDYSSSRVDPRNRNFIVDVGKLKIVAMFGKPFSVLADSPFSRERKWEVDS